MQIKVEQLTQEELKRRGVFSWPIWEKEVSRFNWHYDDIEECYFIKGKVTIEIKGGSEVSFGEGDFVTFPRGLSCLWDIKEPVRKHYNFR